MEDDFLAGDLEKLIHSHHFLHRYMLRALPEPDKEGHETLLKNLMESLNNILTRKDFYYASDQLDVLTAKILDYIDDHVRAGTDITCVKPKS